MKKNKQQLIILLIMMTCLLFIVGCAKSPISNISENTLNIVETNTNTNIILDDINNLEDVNNNTLFSLNEISMHSKKDNCWLVIDNKVYDVTEFINTHPGGVAILMGCGKDATSLFVVRHSKKAQDMLPNYYIGDLAK